MRSLAGDAEIEGFSDVSGSVYFSGIGNIAVYIIIAVIMSMNIFFFFICNLRVKIFSDKNPADK